MSLKLLVDMNLSPRVVRALRQYEALLERGALIVIDETRLRARVLPLQR